MFVVGLLVKDCERLRGQPPAEIDIVVLEVTHQTRYALEQMRELPERIRVEDVVTANVHPIAEVLDDELVGVDRTLDHEPTAGERYEDCRAVGVTPNGTVRFLPLRQ